MCEPQLACCQSDCRTHSHTHNRIAYEMPITDHQCRSLYDESNHNDWRNPRIKTDDHPQKRCCQHHVTRWKTRRFTPFEKMKYAYQRLGEELFRCLATEERFKNRIIQGICHD